MYDWFQGGYSYREPDSDTLGITHSDLSKPLMYKGAPKVLFAGEATTGTNSILTGNHSLKKARSFHVKFEMLPLELYDPKFPAD